MRKKTNSHLRGGISLILIVILITTSFTFSFTTKANSTEEIIINEIMYNPAGADGSHEWIELYNQGETTVNVNGWKLYEAGINHALTLKKGSTTIPSHGYAVITQDYNQFILDHPGFTGNVFDSTFSLKNTGEYIAIKNDLLEIVDDTNYPDKAREGYTIEKNFKNEWEESLVDGGSPGEPNSVIQAMEVEKTVWDGNKWVDEIESYSGNTLRFNISITYHKTQPTSYVLKYITVKDILPDNLTYLGNATPHETTISPDGKTITWDLNSVYLYDGDSYFIEFDAEITGYDTQINNVNVSAYETCPHVWHHQNANATVNILSPNIHLDKNVNRTLIHPGEPVTYTYYINNTGNCNLTNIILTDDKIPTINYITGDTNNNNWLDTNETWTYQATANPTTNTTNIGNVTAQDPLGKTVSDEDTANVTVINAGINVTKKANITQAYPGDKVNYTITVTNTGTDPLYNVWVNDTTLNIHQYIGTLDNSYTFYVEHTLTSTPNPFINTVQAEGYDELGTRYIDTNNAIVEIISPYINVVKTVSSESIHSGDTVTWNITVENTGEIILTNINVTDTLKGILDTDITLNPGDKKYYEYTTNPTVTTTNIVNVTGKYLGYKIYDEDSATVNVLYPGIHLNKTANRTLIHPSETVTYTYTITNTGNCNLTNITLTDDILGVITGPNNGDTNNNNWLDTNETWTYQTTANPTTDTTNIGNVTAQDPLGKTVYNTSIATVFLYHVKSIDVDNDGISETATDANNNMSDGYEQYNDPNNGSNVVESVDGDNDSMIDHFVNTTDDDTPEKYWDPDDDVLSNVTVDDYDNDTEDEWRYDSDGDGDDDMYYDPNDGTVNDIEPPSNVTGLIVSDAKDGKLNLAWDAATDNVGVDHYNIYRDGSFLNITTSTSYQDTGLTNGQTYTYQVSAVDTSGNEGPKSDPVSGTPTSSKQTQNNESNNNNKGTTNHPPVANAGGPYYEYAGNQIQFNGSKSSDPDGDTLTYHWDFGDGNTSNLKNPTHTYTKPGNYTVILLVEDSTGKNDTDKTFAVITTIPNYPPGNLKITGETQGKKNQNYNYTFTATDPDNDTITYNINWGDGNNITKENLTNGTTYETNHSWNSYGIYKITFKATDQNNATTTKTITIYIDIQTINELNGYLIDENSDDIYDLFHNNTTNNDTAVKQQTNGKYLIDDNGDGNWDYIYDPDTKTLEKYTEKPKGESDNTIWYLAGILLILVILGLFLLAGKKKEKKEEEESKKKSKSKKKK